MADKRTSKEILHEVLIKSPDAWRIYSLTLFENPTIVDFRLLGMNEYRYRKAMGQLIKAGIVSKKKAGKFTEISRLVSMRYPGKTRDEKRDNRNPKTPKWMPLKEARDWWDTHHKEMNDGAPPNWGAGEVAALKGIITKLHTMATTNGNTMTHAGMFEVFVRWAISRDHWSSFHRTKWTLTYLNSKFSDIYAELKESAGAKADREKFRAASKAAVERRFNTKAR